MSDKEKVIKSLETCSDVYYGAKGSCSSCSFSQRKNCFAELVYQTIELLKEQEEKPLRCKTCTVRDRTGFCYEWKREVKDDDYCSFGAWKGR